MLFNPQPSDKNAYAHRNPGAPENYCWHLAGEIRAHAKRLGLPISPPDDPAETHIIPAGPARSFLDSLGHALPDPFLADFAAASYIPSKLDQQRLSDLFFAAPHAQARIAAIIEYTPSKWLLQQEIVALGLWPGQTDQHDPRKSKKPYAPAVPQLVIVPSPSDLSSGGAAAEPAEPTLQPAPNPEVMRQLPPNAQTPPPKPPSDVYQVAAELRLAGMCFSGGGIRSATFNLGVLQGLAARGKLGCFDYLSTVSGGGYIHQFLASWIDCENLAKVQQQLTPIPAAPHRALWPDPLRWLRRYSNYLTPQKGLFSADTWVVAAVWLRNTLLNQTVLVATLLLLLLLPHAGVTPSGGITRFVLSLWGEIVSSVLLVILCSYAARAVSSGIVAMPRPGCSPAASAPAKGESPQESTVVLRVLGPMILASLLMSPYLYRSAFWNPIPRQTTEATKMPAGSTPTARSLCNFPLPSAGKATPVPDACAVVTPDSDVGPDSTQRIIAATRHIARASAPAREVNKGCSNASICNSAENHPAKAPEPTSLDNLHVWQHTFSLPWWTLGKGAISLVFLALFAGISMLVASFWVTISEFQRGLATTRILFAFIVVAAAAFGYLLIHLTRVAIFYAAFFLPQALVTRCAIVFLPPLILAIVLVCVDLSIGLIGHLMEDARREWISRLSAWSFIVSFAWIALTGASLLGHWIVATLLGFAYIKHVAVVGWIATTAASVLAGKSPVTGGRPDKAGASKPSLFSALNILIGIGPPVFITGLILVLSYVLEQTLSAFKTQSWTVAHPFTPYVVVFAVLAAVVLFFGWRVDINDFSLHAFYRDRIARCYAGASNPDRRADRFTGFSASDTRLRMVDLLPEAFSSFDAIDLWKPPVAGSVEEAARTKQQTAEAAARDAAAAAEKAVADDAARQDDPDAAANAVTARAEAHRARAAADAAARDRERCYRDSAYYNRRYGGPFPIFSTSINLSFGEDLAYQERKAAAFAFTPLFCGYDVGWTEGKNRRIQFNGFTPTCDFAYPRGGPHMATAVAASGAAISPNWGFHSNPAMAFLLTMFNVRLGWWIRNPRHKEFKYSQFLRDHPGLARYIDENPASPRLALSYLLAELFGLVNDESAYVYLTDGGHFENMGLYELVRRRCMKILISDAEADDDFNFEGIGMAIRKCRIDFGAEINLDLDVLKRNKNYDSKVHFVIGSIKYPEIDEPGSILYIKSTLSAGLPADLVNYRRQDPSFPHDTTLDQWFTETRFESYRRLGHFSIQPNATTAAAAATMARSTDIDHWLDSLDPLP